MRRFHRLAAVVLLALVIAPRTARTQERGASALDQQVRALAVTGRVLVVGAHPDDEDTNLITWLARGRGVETAYLALTRGDGGQNIIGNELGDALGAIRTEELLAARRLDGGRQYFTRAFDFGFSKNAEETFKHWDRDSILGDVVTVVRAFRPQVMIAIFSGTPADGHGHHQVSGILAREAFDAANDTVRFPVRKYGQPWEPQKFYRSARFGRITPTLSWNVGEFDPVLGRSYAEIAAESRSMHRSQGQGTLQRKGVVMDAVARELTRVNADAPADKERSIFDGVDTTFARLGTEARSPVITSALRDVQRMLDSVRITLDLRHPENVSFWLGSATRAVQGARAGIPSCITNVRGERILVAGQTAPPGCSAGDRDLETALEILDRRLQRAVLTANGIAIEVNSDQELLAFGDSMPVNINVINRGTRPVSVASVRLTGTLFQMMARRTVEPDSALRLTYSVIGLVDRRPWWYQYRTTDMFPGKISPADGIGRVSAGAGDLMVPSAAVSEERRRESAAFITLGVPGGAIDVDAGAIQYRAVDRVFGDQSRPAGGVPVVTVAFDRSLEWAVAGKAMDKRLRVVLKSYSSVPRTYAPSVIAPQGVRVDSLPTSITLQPGEERELPLHLRGQLAQGRYEFAVVLRSDMGNSAESIVFIDYPHLRPIQMYRSSAIYISAVDITIPTTLSVAYIRGVGDVVAPHLQALGIPIVLVTPEELPLYDLGRFSTVVVGPRAYEANKALIQNNQKILDFAKNGGTVVVQYGQTEMMKPGVMPFPMKLATPTAARVTLEDAPVTVLDARSKILNGPNKIGASDWKEWVQERALYMPSTIDPRYATPLEMHDTDEPENKGAILMAPVGKGTYIYTTLSLFRQIPAGVNGGPRLLVNLLSAGLSLPTRVQP